MAGGGGDAEGGVGFDAEFEKFVVGQGFAEVRFVEGEKDRFLGLQSLFGNFFVTKIWVFGRVDSEDDEAGGGNGVFDLGLDGFFEIIGRVFETSSVNQDETVVDFGDDIIASGSLFAGDDGDVFVCKTIQQTGFTSVGLTDQSYDREITHNSEIIAQKREKSN